LPDVNESAAFSSDDSTANLVRRLPMRRIAASVALLLAGTVAAGAQFPRLPGQGGSYGPEPGYWVGLSYGYVSGTTIDDPASATTWQFGYTSELRGTIEKTMGQGFTVGASAGFATAPLTYSPSIGSPACPISCAADANISQYMAFVRAGTGMGFHTIYELEAGATEFSKFRTRDADSTLAPDQAKYDFSFGLGGGFGYGFSRMSEAYVGYHWDLVLHPQGNGGGVRDAPRRETFRAGFRLGF
jgi:hypothetical protein